MKRITCAAAMLLAGTLSAARGPETQPFDKAPYARVLYVSQAGGADTPQAGTMQAPLRSVGYALTRGGEAAPSGRIAIVVAEGNYREPKLALKPGVDLYGGFQAGTWGRNVFEFASVFDGGGTGRVLTGSDSARLDGFHLRNGRVPGPGGALLCDGVSPTITNNIFENNRTLTPRPWNPKALHEDANDGGAIACDNGCRAVVANNLFVHNATETGRGGAIAVNRSSPEIRENVVMENSAGLADPMRSSDGGGISIYDHSRPLLRDNLIIANRAIASNDGGGIFVALWSSPVIQSNVLAGNYGDDDGGALFVGGQKHHYGTPKDVPPPAGEFLVTLTGNLFAGNRHGSANSGTMRVTMESRLRMTGNLMAQNPGGLNLQASDIAAERNTILDPVHVRPPGRVSFANSILRGGFRAEGEVAVRHCATLEETAGEGNTNAAPKFAGDGASWVAAKAVYDARRFRTTFTLPPGTPLPAHPEGRPVRFGDRWSVVQSAVPGGLAVWGDLSAQRWFELAPSYTLKEKLPGVEF